MKIARVIPHRDWTLSVVAEDGRTGVFDVRPYLVDEAFEPLKALEEFEKITNGGYFIEWGCGADLSADTLEAHWQVIRKVAA